MPFSYIGLPYMHSCLFIGVHTLHYVLRNKIDIPQPAYEGVYVGDLFRVQSIPSSKVHGANMGPMWGR